MGRETYSEVCCDYINDENFWCVDAWKTGDDDEEGKVVAVIHEKYGDVFYIEPEAMFSPKAQEVIKSFVNEIREREIKRIAEDFMGDININNQSMYDKVSSKLTELAKNHHWDLLWLDNMCRNEASSVNGYIFG